MKDVVLFIGYFGTPEIFSQEIRDYFGKDIKIAFLYDKHRKGGKTEIAAKYSDMVYQVDFTNGEAEAAIDSIGERILAVTTRGEASIPNYSQLVKVLQKYANVPSAQALLTASNKIATRRALQKSFPEVNVNSIELGTNAHIDTVVSLVEEKLAYPVIVKPAGLSTSRLVSRANNAQELELIIRKIKTQINKIYDGEKDYSEPQLIIEEFVEGPLYSVDVYIDKDGNNTYCPPVKVTTGVAAGKHDYYGYLQICPAEISKKDQTSMRTAATKVIKAVGLNSCTAHIELIASVRGWKIVEVGPRIGGFRAQMYKLSHGISHNINDLLVKFAPQKIDMGKMKQYSALLKIYADKEGVIKQIKGLDEIKASKNVAYVSQNIEVGQKFSFARNGGIGILSIILYAATEEGIIENASAVESKLKIDISSARSK